MDDCQLLEDAVVLFLNFRMTYDPEGLERTVSKAIIYLASQLVTPVSRTIRESTWTCIKKARQKQNKSMLRYKILLENLEQ